MVFAWLLLATWLPCLPHPMTLAAEPTPINSSWTGPYGGVPAALIRGVELEPGFEGATEGVIDRDKDLFA